jgi:hypothetical protein
MRDQRGLEGVGRGHPVLVESATCDEVTALETDAVIVKGSAVLKGQFGVFAKKKFKRGETIFSVKGPVMKTPTRYSFSLDIDKHIDPVREDGQFDFGHYLNHSCDPNTFISIVDEQTSSYIDIVARRDIAEDAELNFDYASLEYDTIAQVACECDTRLCRGKIHGFRDLPDKTRDDYEQEGMIPAYLLKMKPDVVCRDSKTLVPLGQETIAVGDRRLAAGD